MKSILLFACISVAVAAFSQDCTGYYFLQNNKTVEMSVFNKKGDISAKQVYTVSNVSSSGGSTMGDLTSEMFDKKGKSIGKGASKMKCTGGIMMIDMKLSLPQQTTEQIGQTDVKADNLYIEYPSSMKVGDALKDANMDLDINGANGLKQSINMEIKERKVDAKEKITTPAGSWDCFKISFKGKMKIKTMGIGIPMNIDGTEWFAPGFGVVKTESKNGGTEITSIK
ncbi:MAG: hypothetical protein ABI687_09180 [Flavitalea sp.]